VHPVNENFFNSRLSGLALSRIPQLRSNRKREAQPFRSKIDGLLPLSKHRAAVLRRNVKARNNEVRKRKMTLKFYSRTPSLLQGFTSLPGSSV
jgi:hypothetical protein